MLLFFNAEDAETAEAAENNECFVVCLKRPIARGTSHIAKVSASSASSASKRVLRAFHGMRHPSV